MKYGKRIMTAMAAVCVLLAAIASAQDQNRPDPKDVFKGKLFAPQIILEHRDALGLTKEQFTAIRAAVVEVQSGVAGHEWDLREAYMEVLARLDESPVDEDDRTADLPVDRGGT